MKSKILMIFWELLFNLFAILAIVVSLATLALVAIVVWEAIN